VIGLARDPGRQDVGVVPARDRQERIGLLDAGVLEHVAVEPEPHDRSGLEPRGRRANAAAFLSITVIS
jgi:hypothetical protein